jgi:hypothetical protein
VVPGPEVLDLAKHVVRVVLPLEIVAVVAFHRSGASFVCGSVTVTRKKLNRSHPVTHLRATSRQLHQYSTEGTVYTTSAVKTSYNCSQELVTWVRKIKQGICFDMFLQVLFSS